MYKNCIQSPKRWKKLQKSGKKVEKRWKKLQKGGKSWIFFPFLQKVVLSCNPILLDLPIFPVPSNKIQQNTTKYKGKKVEKFVKCC